MTLQTFTISDINSWDPCYSPLKHLPNDWAGTALDMLQHPTIPAHDKIWLCRRYKVMNARGLRLAAVDCARRAQTYPKNYTPDPRTLAAIQAAEDFANDLIGARVLEEYRKGARAAYAAAYAAADAAAYAAGAAADADARNKERQLQVDYLIRMCSEHPEHFVCVGDK